MAPVVREEDWEILKAHYIWIFLGLAALVALYAVVHNYIMKGKAHPPSLKATARQAGERRKR